MAQRELLRPGSRRRRTAGVGMVALEHTGLKTLAGGVADVVAAVRKARRWTSFDLAWPAGVVGLGRGRLKGSRKVVRGGAVPGWTGWARWARDRVGDKKRTRNSTNERLD